MSKKQRASEVKELASALLKKIEEAEARHDMTWIGELTICKNGEVWILCQVALFRDWVNISDGRALSPSQMVRYRLKEKVEK